MTNCLNGVSVGMIINNPDVGTFVVAAINEEYDRVLLVNTRHTAFNLYVGAWGLQKKTNKDEYCWSQGHYFGNSIENAVNYVLAIEE